MLLFVKGKETNGPERMNQASTEFSTYVAARLKQGELMMGEKCAEIPAISNWQMQ